MHCRIFDCRHRADLYGPTRRQVATERLHGAVKRRHMRPQTGTVSRTHQTKGYEKMKQKYIMMALAVALMMAAAPLVYSEGADDSSALTGDNVLDLTNDSAIVYVASGDGHSATFSVDLSTIPSGYSASSISWKLNDLDDGTTLVSFSDTTNTYTMTGVSSVTVYGKAVGTLEIEAYISGTNYYASGIVVVFSAPTETASTFYYFIKIYPGVYSYFNNENLPADVTQDEIQEGFWVSVTYNSQAFGSNNFNALTAFEYFCRQYDGWQFSASSYGWIDTFLGLGTYQGTNGSWIYWAQYHATSGSDAGWAFNNTTLAYITSVESQYIGLIFWESPSSSDMPAFPGLPNSDTLKFEA